MGRFILVSNRFLLALLIKFGYSFVRGSVTLTDSRRLFKWPSMLCSNFHNMGAIRIILFSSLIVSGQKTYFVLISLSVKKVQWHCESSFRLGTHVSVWMKMNLVVYCVWYFPVPSNTFCRDRTPWIIQSFSPKET